LPAASAYILRESGNLQNILIALVLTHTIFCLIQNPPTITLELLLVSFNNLVETGFAKEILNITIVDLMDLMDLMFSILILLLQNSHKAKGMALACISQAAEKLVKISSSVL
jgi:hypothetical protein